MPSPVISEAIDRLLAGEDLGQDGASEVLELVMNGEAGDAQTAAFLIALRAKGETAEELAGLAATVRAHAEPVTPPSVPFIDTCGTGGGRSTFNISTAAALVAAAAGAKVAKHGNRSVSSKSGSADVLEALGVHIGLSAEQVARSVSEVGVGFMFAPHHHPAMKHAAPVRKELAVRTIFNILGPLTNPAGAKNQVMGVFHPDLVGIQARVLQRLGSRHVMVVHGLEGLDEISIGGETLVGELKDGEVREYRVHPRQFGIEASELSAIQVGSGQESAGVIRDVLAGKAGPARDIVALNAGAAIYVSGLAGSLEEGVTRARGVIDSGAAGRKLDELARFTNAFRA